MLTQDIKQETCLVYVVYDSLPALVFGCYTSSSAQIATLQIIIAIKQNHAIICTQNVDFSACLNKPDHIWVIIQRSS